MKKKAAIKLATDLSHRNVNHDFFVIRMKRGERKTYHVVHGGIEEVESLALRLGADSWKSVYGVRTPPPEIRVEWKDKD